MAVIPRPKCHRCGASISGLEQHVLVDGRRFHQRCYRCVVCQEHLMGSQEAVSDENGNLLCFRCDRRRCARCHQVVTGPPSEVENLVYHPRCLSCVHCGVVLQQVAGKPHAPSCFRCYSLTVPQTRRQEVQPAPQTTYQDASSIRPFTPKPDTLSTLFQGHPELATKPFQILQESAITYRGVEQNVTDLVRGANTDPHNAHGAKTQLAFLEAQLHQLQARIDSVVVSDLRDSAGGRNIRKLLTARIERLLDYIESVFPSLAH